MDRMKGYQGINTSLVDVGIPAHQFDGSNQFVFTPSHVFIVPTDRVTFDVKLCEQVPLVIPVTCNTCPLFAAVKELVLKLAAPLALALTPVTGVCAAPLII